MAQITAKELSAISDLLSVEENLIAKYKAFANQTTDMTLKAKYEQIAQRHQQHFDQLYGNLKWGEDMEAQMQKMNEQQTMMDLLSSQKYLTGMYQSFGNECATPVVRSCMFSILEEEQRISEEIFTQMNTRGYYPVEKAEDTKVDQARMKFRATAKVW